MIVRLALHILTVFLKLAKKLGNKKGVNNE